MDDPPELVYIPGGSRKGKERAVEQPETVAGPSRDTRRARQGQEQRSPTRILSDLLQEGLNDVSARLRETSLQEARGTKRRAEDAWEEAKAIKARSKAEEARVREIRRMMEEYENRVEARRAADRRRLDGLLEEVIDESE